MPEARTLTPLAVAALALLAVHPSHPYEMYQTLMQRSEDRLVKVRPGSLPFPALIPAAAEEGNI